MDTVSPGEATLRAIKAGGFRLKPTRTVDKSKPIIKAEGESFQPVLNTQRYVDPYTQNDKVTTGLGAAPSTPQQQNGQSNYSRPTSSQLPPPPPPPPPMMNQLSPRPVPPPPPPPTMLMAKSHSAIALSNSKPSASPPIDRHALMGDIKRGIKLRKSVVVDKSRPILAGEFDDQLPAIGEHVAVGGDSSDTSSLSSQDMAQALISEMRAVQQQYAALNRDNIVDVSQPRRRPTVMYATRRTPPRDMVKCTLDSPPSPPPALNRSVRDLASAMFGAAHTITPSKSTSDLHPMMTQNNSGAATSQGVYRTLPTKAKAMTTQQQSSNATLTLQRNTTPTPSTYTTDTPLRVYTKSTESLDSGAHSFSPAPTQASPSRQQLVDRNPISTASVTPSGSPPPVTTANGSSVEATYIVGVVERAKHSLASSAASATCSSSSASSEQSGTNSPPNVPSAPPLSTNRTALAQDFMQRFDMNRPSRPTYQGISAMAAAVAGGGVESSVGSMRTAFEHAGTAPPPSAHTAAAARTLPRRLPSGGYILNTTFTSTPTPPAPAPLSVGGTRGVSVDRADPHRFLPDVSHVRRQYENNTDVANTKTSTPQMQKVYAHIKSPPPKMILQKQSPFTVNSPTSNISASSPSAQQTWLKAVNENGGVVKAASGQNFNTHRKSPLKVDYETTTTTTTRTVRISPDKLPMTEAARDILAQCASIDIEQLRGQFVFDIDLNSDNVVQLQTRVLKQ